MATNQAEGFTNSILVCVDCDEEFVFTASAQKYFADRGFHDPPKRCKSCYTEFRKRINGEAEIESVESEPLPPPQNGDVVQPGDRV